MNRQCCLHPEADHRDQHPRLCCGDIWHTHDDHCAKYGYGNSGEAGWCLCRCKEWEPAKP